MFSDYYCLIHKMCPFHNDLLLHNCSMLTYITITFCVSRKWLMVVCTSSRKTSAQKQ